MLRLFLILIALCSSSYAQITQSVDDKAKPLYEFGAAMVGAVVPAYPGSDVQNTFFIPIPFPTFFYRGEVLRADEEGGMRSRFFKSDTFEVNLSIGGSLPADSEDVKAREGMPDLNTVVELGPGLLATLWSHKENGKSYKLGLNLPLRAALGVDFWRVRQHGLVFNPLLYLITEGLIGKKIITFTGLSTVYATQRFHRLFYQVDQAFVTPERALYGSRSGYMSTTLSQGFSTSLSQNIVGFLGLSYMNLQGNANRRSPLFKRRDNFSAALGLVWWFYESTSRAKQ
jgi:outer membrane scaffolding protein for murein synthesis (MipA/OmpV family)